MPIPARRPCPSRVAECFNLLLISSPMCHAAEPGEDPKSVSTRRIFAVDAPGANPVREKIGRCLSVWGLHCSFSEVWDRAGADHNLCGARLSSLCNGPGRILAAWLGTARHLVQTL